MRLIDADALKQHIDKLPALPDGNFAGNHSALKALINMQPTIEQPTNCSEFPNNSDTISRQEAIDALDKRFDDIPMGQTKEILMLRRDLRKLPSAQPMRKTGKWLPYKYAKPGYEYKFHVCSVCGCCDEYVSDVPRPNGTIGRLKSVRNFCPNCGARMEGE